MPRRTATDVLPAVAGSRPSERALAVLWQRAHSLPEGLVTEDGRRLRVVYPGRLNPRAGPDFHDAILATDTGTVITGDVELHLKASDWYAHRHHADPNYNGVVLHVVLWPRGQAMSTQQSGATAPVASIAHATSRLERPDTRPDGAMARWRRLRGRTIGEALDRAGDERFLAKSRGFTLELSKTFPDQVLYRALMEALGYASNRRAFGELADMVPIARLARLRKEPPSTRPLAIRAILTGGAGLLSHVRPDEEARLLRAPLRHFPTRRAMSSESPGRPT